MTFPIGTRAQAELITPAIWNADLVANLNFIRPLTARKSGDQSVVSSTTFVDATGMAFAIGASETWHVHIASFFQVSGGGDLKTRWTVPSGATGHAWASAVTLVGNRVAVASDLVIASSSTGDFPIDSYATVINSTTPGTVQFQFAQFASDATATILRDNAALVAIRIV